MSQKIDHGLLAGGSRKVLENLICLEENQVKEEIQG